MGQRGLPEVQEGKKPTGRPHPSTGLEAVQRAGQLLGFRHHLQELVADQD